MTLGALMALFVGAAAVAWIGPCILLGRRFPATASPGLCAACGYNLSGLAADAPCPECGADRARHIPGASEDLPARRGRLSGVWVSVVLAVLMPGLGALVLGGGGELVPIAFLLNLTGLASVAIGVAVLTRRKHFTRRLRVAIALGMGIASVLAWGVLLTLARFDTTSEGPPFALLMTPLVQLVAPPIGAIPAILLVGRPKHTVRSL